LKTYGVETPEEMQHRIDVLAQVNEMVQKWMKIAAFNANCL